MNQFQLNYRCVFLVSFVFLLGCQDIRRAANTIQFREPTATILSRTKATPVPTTTIQPTPIAVITKDTYQPQFSPPATMTVDKEKELYQVVITNGGCSLPCFLGVVLGKTTIEEANAFFGGLGKDYFAVLDSIASSTTTQVYYTYLYTVQASLQIDIGIHFEVENQRIVRVVSDFTLKKDPATPLIEKSLQKFTIKEIFHEYGPPDLIYILKPKLGYGGGYEFTIFYMKHKFMIQYGGAAKGISEGEGLRYELCPNIGNGDISTVKIAVASPDDRIDLRKYVPIQPQNDPFYLPIQTVTQMSVQEFYHFVINEAKPCVLVKPFE